MEPSSLMTPIKRQSVVVVAVSPAVITPDRVYNPSRIRNKNFALSVSDVRRTALQLRKSKPNAAVKELDLVPIKRVRSRVDKSNETEKLPLKYEMLCKFFNALVSSIRLLRLKRQPTTLTKLSQNIEVLTDRRFTLDHLGQLKHIVPDIVAVKKIRVQDDKTGCMKEDLLISLEVHDVQTNDEIAKDGGGYSRLKGFFHSRIVDYARTHPESDDIPAGQLPNLFYKPKQEPETSLNETSVIQPTTLTAPSFKRRFSSRTNPLPETPIKSISTATVEDSEVASTPLKFDSTPPQLASTPARLMAATPTLTTPKRSLLVDDSNSGLPSKSAKRRLLDVLPEKSEVKFEDSNSSASNDLLNVLPENLLHSLKEKEQRTLEEQDPIVSQARMRQQLLSGVPKLFDIIRLLFQSIRRSVMTKDELIHKIITGHLDIVDRGEVEEMLKLLQEIAPEFITEQTCLSGDVLLRLNKSSCADTIRAKLLEAE